GFTFAEPSGLWLPARKIIGQDATSRLHLPGARAGRLFQNRQSQGLKLESQFMLRVTEIFRSIQGESTHAGRPCTFVRLTGCPMRCVWCDSEYTFTGGDQLSVDEVTRQVRNFGCRLVEVTGGERVALRAAISLMTCL